MNRNVCLTGHCIILLPVIRLRLMSVFIMLWTCRWMTRCGLRYLNPMLTIRRWRNETGSLELNTSFRRQCWEKIQKEKMQNTLKVYLTRDCFILLLWQMIVFGKLSHVMTRHMTCLRNWIMLLWLPNASKWRAMLLVDLRNMKKRKSVMLAHWFITKPMTKKVAITLKWSNAWLRWRNSIRSMMHQ